MDHISEKAAALEVQPKESYWINAWRKCAGVLFGREGKIFLLFAGEGIEVAFIFGSLARSKERAESDVDLMVIGTIGLRSLSSRLAGVSDQIGREINPHSLSIEEFRRRKQNGNHFLSNVIESPKLFIIGSENDLEAMGR